MWFVLAGSISAPRSVTQSSSAAQVSQPVPIGQSFVDAREDSDFSP
jgi:hypothetical protein